MKVNEPDAVARQYASDANLEARRAIYANQDGPDPRELAFEAVREVEPRQVLEVGGGPGELAARVQEELRCEVVMVDSSPRMVELAAGRGVDARLGDVQMLPFDDGSFDVAVAAWMLYHVPDLDRALAELARVLGPGGRLVAVTNAGHHLAEIRRIAGGAMWERIFRSEEAAEPLRRYFAKVERRDAYGWITIESDEAVERYVGSLQHEGAAALGLYELPLQVTRASSVFVAEKAR